MTPSRRLLALLGILFLAALPLGARSALNGEGSPGFEALWWGLLGALLLLAGLDAAGLHWRSSPRLKRLLPGHLPQGRWSEVRLSLAHDYRLALSVELFDHLPAGMLGEPLPLRLELRPGIETECGYRLRPLERGHFRFQRCEVALPSLLGLWQGRRLVELPGETRVYPDFARLYRAQLMAVDTWLGRLGVRQLPRRGLGQTFHQLREFRDGDTLRQIDWKATARKHTPIVREYRDERDQQILFLLDCGRHMRSRDGELAHFDHALDACLLLAYVALRQGDAVGLATLAGEQDRYLAPAKGNAQLNALLNAVHDLQTTRRPADFAAATNLLLRRQRRRALVVILSNLRDEDDDELPAAVRRLARRHRVLVASLREEVLDRLCRTPVENQADALAYCGTVDYLNARAGLHERLAAAGIPLLDVRPAELGPELVGRYLAWKRAGVL
ncbi:Uncharacterized conserved protein, DUF58 family, contains vWF domain [Azotobacter beijerinckii]|uniref:Uncharacterized conserved protein, DUF58 family, contains vWF domain n=1 Tax=Azotobacter beijerinckii TaxID=170623 RepID=A0A1H9M9E7_9GAMM|nr:DUF58 domain-containing protein [Azotobacter beijerinckii]SER20304.1 Uncharacterized conserved protein, DUF58 family, contains vWF domain [Azotobacter beijerinckii]